MKSPQKIICILAQELSLRYNFYGSGNLRQMMAAAVLTLNLSILFGAHTRRHQLA